MTAIRLGLVLVLPFVFSSGCVSEMGSLRRSSDYVPISPEQIHVSIRSHPDTVSEETRQSIEEAMAEVYGTAESPTHELSVSLEKCEGLSWLWPLPPVWRSSSRILYNVTLKDQEGHVLLDGKRSRYWRRYYATYSSARLVTDFVEDLGKALTETSHRVIVPDQARLRGSDLVDFYSMVIPCRPHSTGTESRHATSWNRGP